ncbi:MAG: helix-turn-helix transcriptional regulator [Thermomicrobiales bacterium]
MEFYLTQRELAKRWKISPRTLENMRQHGTGPGYVKIGRAVRYSIVAVEKYERENFCEIARRHGARQFA